MPIIACQSAGLLNQRFMPIHDHQRVISLFRNGFDLVAPSPLNSFGITMITEKSKELRLTFIEEKASIDISKDVERAVQMSRLWED